MSPDLSTTNLWLAVIAICTVLEFLAVAIALIVAARMMKRVTEGMDTALQTVQALERRAAPMIDKAGPLIDKAALVMEDFRDVTARVKRADDAAQAAVARVSDGFTQAKNIAMQRVWPVLGLLRGARAAYQAFTRRRTPVRDEEEAEAVSRFDYEGGGHNVRHAG
jgi:uncharacterized protein YoxC